LVLGHVDGDKALFTTAQNDTKKLLQKLDKHFENNTFLASSKFFTLADFSLGSLLFYLFSLCVTKDELTKLPNLTRWFTTLALQNETVSVWGNFKWCVKNSEPELKDSEPKEKKEQPKKEQPKKDNKKNNEEDQKNKDDAKAEKERKQKEKELELEKEEAEHKRKVKEWIELPGQFDFESFKRL